MIVTHNMTLAKKYRDLSKILNNLLRSIFKMGNLYKTTAKLLRKRLCEISGKKVYVQSVEKKKNTPNYFNSNYRREMKLVPLIMDYCLL